jgi:DNA-binding NtrC family response regulator
MEAAAPERVLVVDDAESVCLAITMMLQKLSLEVVAARTYVEALTLLKRGKFAAALIDVYLGPHSGLDLAEEVAMTHPETRILMMSGSVLLEDEVKARPKLAQASVLHKPFTRNELVECIRKAVNKAA